MAQAANQELVDRFEEFYRQYYADEVGELARKYPREQKSLTLDWGDVYRFDHDLADDLIRHPDEIREAAREALRLYDLPVDVKLGKAHVRVKNLGEQTEIRQVRAEHLNTLVSVQGIVRKATDVRPKIREAVFVCQRCGAETVVPQSEGGFQEPYQCESCERQGPFKLNAERSDFIDAQKLRIQESPEGLDGGETPQSVDIHIEDDITGRVSPGDHITATGILRLDQSESGKESPIFDIYMEGSQIVVEDEQFEEMNITDEDEELIHEISNDPDIYEKMVGSIAPAIYGHDQAKLAMALQLFSGVSKRLPDGSRIRGDLHMLLIGDPGTGKCVSGDTRVPLSDGTERPIRELVESNLVDPKPIDDGVWDDADIDLPTLTNDTSVQHGKATRVWKRDAPETMFRIETESGSRVEVTPSHPLFVQQNGRHAAIRADDLHVGQEIFIAPTMVADGGVAVESGPQSGVRAQTTRIKTIDRYEPEEDWVYDLEVAGTHNYVTNGVISHNSQLLSYVKNIAPRSVYTSGKGSSSAGLTAAAVRDDFGDGNQWTLEAGALVLADMGIAAVDELDKMEADDRSAMHEALEQQQISISKAGINATLKSRCSLLGAANPKYGRFDQYEPIGEQIDLEPALISRFDLIFTVTDKPNQEEDSRLAKHILQTNYAGELNTQRDMKKSSKVSEQQIADETREVKPDIDSDILRKYIAYSRRNCYPTMTPEARQAIEDFYVDLRSRGADEDAPVPVTARQLEAIVRLAEASARVRLSDTVEQEDADRVITIVRDCLADIGIDPETGEFDADIIETGRSKTQRDRVKDILSIVESLEDEFQEGAPIEEVLDTAEEHGTERSKAEHQIENLKQKGELYEPSQGHLRTT